MKKLLLIALLVYSSNTIAQVKEAKTSSKDSVLIDTLLRYYISKPTKYYTIDWNKVKNFSDLKKVLSALNITVYPNYSKQYKFLQPYLKIK